MTGARYQPAPGGLSAAGTVTGPVGPVADAAPQPQEPEPLEPRPAAEPETADTAAGTARARALISTVSLGSLAIGIAAVYLHLDLARWVSLLVFCLLGIGSAPWQPSRALRLPARLALTVLTGLAVLTTVPLVMIMTGAWHPAVAFMAVAAVCAPLHVAGAWLARKDRAPKNRGGSLARSPAVGLAGLGALLCIAAALTHRHTDPGVGGFLPVIGPVWYAGLALVLVGLVSARGDDERQQVIPVVLLLLVLTLTPALVYDGPRSQSAAKHVDLVQQIRTLHRPNSAVLLYNAWAGFFAAMAWVSDVTGIRNPMHLATFWPPLVGLLRVAALRFLFGQVLRSTYQCWVAVTMVLLVDSLGQDYFSPQSVGLVIGLVTYGLALSNRTGGTRLVLLLVAGCVLAFSHQLSPYVVGGVLVVLVVFRQVRPWWTPVLVLGPAGLWTVLHRSEVSPFVKLNSIGRLENFRPPKHVESPGLHRLPMVEYTVDALLLALAVLGTLALIGFLRRRRELRSWAIICCPGVGLALVAINPYGQEGIFRATVFGIPWLASLAATCFPPDRFPPDRFPHDRFPADRRIRSRLPLLATTATLTATFLIATFGRDTTSVIRSSDVAAFRYLRAETAKRPEQMHYPLQLGEGDLPGPMMLRNGNYWPLGREEMGADPVRQQPAPFDADREVRRLTKQLIGYSQEPLGQAELYVIWSPVNAEYDYEYAIQLPDQFAALRDAFRRSPYWEVGFEQNGTVVFRFVPSRYGEGAP